MALGAYTHTHTYPHESDFKKPDMRQPHASVHLVLKITETDNICMHFCIPLYYLYASVSF